MDMLIWAADLTWAIDLGLFTSQLAGRRDIAIGNRKEQLYVIGKKVL